MRVRCPLLLASMIALVLSGCGSARRQTQTSSEAFRETSGDLSGFYWQINGPPGAVARAVHAVRTGKDRVIAHFIAVPEALGHHDCTIHITPVTVRVYGHQGPEAVAFCRGLGGK